MYAQVGGRQPVAAAFAPLPATFDERRLAPMY